MKNRVFLALKSLSESSDAAAKIVNEMNGPVDVKDLHKVVTELNNKIIELRMTLSSEDDLTEDQASDFAENFAAWLKNIPADEWVWRYDLKFFEEQTPQIRKIAAKALIEAATAKKIPVNSLWVDVFALNGEL